MASVRRQREVESQGREAALREALDARLDPDESSLFELAVAQRTRDELAVRALYFNAGDVKAALTMLGFDVRGLAMAEVRVIALKVFDTDSVRALMDANLSKLVDAREKIVARQIQIALHGTDEQATRSALLLSKIGGWQTSPDTVIDNRKVINVTNLLGTAMGEPSAMSGGAHHNALGDLLGHEPGAPIAVHSEAIEE